MDHAFLDCSSITGRTSRQRDGRKGRQARGLRGRQRHLQDRTRRCPTPPIDAKSMAKRLRNVGFDVVEGTNLGRDAMTAKLLDFGKKARRRRRRAVLLCWPRHRGERRELSVADRRRPGVGDGRQAGVGDQRRPHPRPDHATPVKLVFLDACRDNPFATKIRSAKGAAPSTCRPALPR